jgi:hypothetical protein
MSDTVDTLDPDPGRVPAVGTLYCSFCFKSQHHVRKLVSGPAGVFICDECVTLCTAVVAGHPVAGGPAQAELPTERLLESLGAIEATLRGKTNQLQRVVDLLRARAVSWAAIGAALGISRQAAWERFS